MFFKPTTVASMVAKSSKDDGSPYDLYSDLHKDAIGCRPGQAQWDRYYVMSPIERIVEHKHLGEWMEEETRIEALRIEVAKFDVSRQMEYLMRREGLCERRAFQMMLRDRCTRPYPNDNLPSWADLMETVEHYGWDYLMMDAKLPRALASDFEAKWAELRQEEGLLANGLTIAEVFQGGR